MMPSSTVREGSAVDTVCRCRSTASFSTGAPSAASAGFVTDCQPSAGVAIWLIVPARADTSPIVAHVAVTVIVPLGGIVTVAGSSHCTPFVSFAAPFVIVAPAWPMRTKSALEYDATLRAMPLILTLLDRASSCAVAGLNDR
ncbi:hypothetical protein FEP83_05948 [Burkholderia multivorans]|nr:hypothetical protein [Burkholderia multivorans]